MNPKSNLLIVIFLNLSLFYHANLCFSQIKIKNDIQYYFGNDYDKEYHILDIYIPDKKEKSPVLIFIHGGAWKERVLVIHGIEDKIAPIYQSRNFYDSLLANRKDVKLYLPLNKDHFNVISEMDEKDVVTEKIAGFIMSKK